MDKDRERAAHPDWKTKLCFMQYKTFPTRTRTISNKMERRTDCPIWTLISNNYGRHFFFQTNNPNNPIFFLLRKIMQSPPTKFFPYADDLGDSWSIAKFSLHYMSIYKTSWKENLAVDQKSLTALFHSPLQIKQCKA